MKWISTKDRMPAPGTLIVKRWRPSCSVWAGFYHGTDKEKGFDEWIALPSGDNEPNGEPNWICLEGMNEDEFAAYEYGSKSCLDAVKRVLDGEDKGEGDCNPPWQPVRARLLELLEEKAK